MLATRLKRILIQTIHQDQSGFLPKRQMKNNIRIILNTLEYYEAHMEMQTAMIFLDAEKAFDNLNWNFMLHQLGVLQVGERFLKLIKAIYTQQKAKVRINGTLMKEIQIQKGTRRGAHSLHYYSFLL